MRKSAKDHPAKISLVGPTSIPFFVEADNCLYVAVEHTVKIRRSTPSDKYYSPDQQQVITINETKLLSPKAVSKNSGKKENIARTKKAVKPKGKKAKGRNRLT
jgi:hypothetical protein